ncbi:hypothetical protein AD945_06310 [Gluconobacter albidus]|uniref:Uncharacterized protein n=2 Tax=Gluconobacter albidus TaxID=318683 RepID=A0A149TKD3_9PROT|nr:hypothetical protein AD945_06310 [Gluconobacter albidus]
MFSEFDFSCTEIRDVFPRLSNLGTSSLGEDSDMCGDTLDEAIRDGPRGRNLQFNLEAIQELQKLLGFTNKEIDRITQTWVLLSVDPKADVEEPPNWGRYSTYRAFWEAVLRAFVTHVEIQKHMDV